MKSRPAFHLSIYWLSLSIPHCVVFPLSSLPVGPTNRSPFNSSHRLEVVLVGLQHADHQDSDWKEFTLHTKSFCTNKFLEKRSFYNLKIKITDLKSRIKDSKSLITTDRVGGDFRILIAPFGYETETSLLHYLFFASKVGFDSNIL